VFSHRASHCPTLSIMLIWNCLELCYIVPTVITGCSCIEVYIHKAAHLSVTVLCPTAIITSINVHLYYGVWMTELHGEQIFHGRTSNIEIVHYCQTVCGCELPRVLLVTRCKEFIKIFACTSLSLLVKLFYFFCTVIIFSCYSYGE